MQSKRFLRMTGTIFAMAALAHLLRLVMGWPVMVGGWTIPLWVSGVALVGAGVLSFIGLRLAKNG
jgi:hypothetical protein